jgi:HEAT repeat protein
MLASLDPDVRRSAPTRRQTVLSITTLALMSLVVGAAVPASAIPEQQATRTEAERSGRAPKRPAESSLRRITDKSMSVEVRSQTLTNKTRQDPAGRVEDAEPTTDVQGLARGQVDRAVAALTREALAEGTRIGAESLREMLGVMQERAEQKGQQDERTRLLMNVLKTDTSATLRRIAAWGLAEHTNETGVTAALAEALRKDASAEVREMSAWALGDAGKDRAASDALVAAAKSDADDKVRATAIWALGDAGDESALGVLTTALSSRDTRLREVALWAIGNMEPSKAPREVIAALGDSSARVRKLAAWALFNIADPDAVSALEAGFDREKEPEVRRAFVRALAATGEKSADALSKLLGSNDPEVRALAVKALAGAGAAGPWPWPWPKPRPFP